MKNIFLSIALIFLSVPVLAGGLHNQGDAIVVGHPPSGNMIISDGGNLIKDSGSTWAWLVDSIDSMVPNTITINGYPLTGNIVLTAADVGALSSQVNADWNATSGPAKILNEPIIPTNTNQLTNGAGFITSSALSNFVTNSSLTTTLSNYVTSSSLSSTLSGYATTSALSSGLSGKQNTITTGTSSQYFKGDLTLGTFLTDVRGAISVSGNGSYNSSTGAITINQSQAYDGTTQRLGAFPVFGTGTVSSGAVVFNLTTDGTSTGTAIFPNSVITNSVNISVSDATAIYPSSWAFSNSNKTLTVTINKASPTGLISLLGLNLLSAPIAAANGSVVKIQVWGY